MKRLSLARAIRNALVSAAASTVMIQSVGHAQVLDEEEDVAEQGLITVTGSRIKRIDYEAPQPVTVISREDIEATGEISVSEVLRRQPFNQFGSHKERSGSSAQSQSTVSLRGLGAGRTLVLLDGRRVAGGAPLGAGSATNLNTIPLAAVERIEILRDGASAIYGADAMGGVVNIILRRDYEGVQLGVSASRPSESGGDEDVYTVVGGVSSGKGNVTFTLEHTEKDIVFNNDRSFPDVFLSSFGFPASFAAFNPTFGFTLGTFADPRCPTSLNSDPEFPNSQVDPQQFVIPNVGTFVASRCRFNYAATSAEEASIDRDSFFVNANYAVTEDISLFTSATFTRTESFGRYAPAPIVGADPFAPQISMANPNNPTAPGALAFNPAHLPAIPCEFQTDGMTPCDDYSQWDFDGDRVADIVGPFDLSLFYRNVPTGPRDSDVDDIFYEYLLGFEGSLDYFSGMEWNIAARYSRSTSDSSGSGFAFQKFLQDRIDDGSFDVFAVNGPTDPNISALFSTETTEDFEHRLAGMDGSIQWDLFQLKNGPVPVLFGAEYNDEKFSRNFDAQQNAGNIAGGGGEIKDTSAGRTVFALFGELQVPVLHNLEANFALRRDDYNDFGTTINPKVSVGYRPFDSLLLRATWGTGFRAPTFEELYDPRQSGFSFPIDITNCFNNGGDSNQNGTPDWEEAYDDDINFPPGSPCNFIETIEFFGGNGDLIAEQSENLTAGFVWNLSDDFSVSFDYYDIELEDEPSSAGLRTILNRELEMNMGGCQGFEDGPNAVRRDANCRIISIENRNINFAGRKTQGFDVDARYSFSIGQFGDFGAQFSGSKVNTYSVDEGRGLGWERTFDSWQPPYRAQLGLDWSLGDFDATIIGNTMASASDGEGARVGSFTTWDVQFGWATPWNGKITMGARNLFEEEPPQTTQGLYTNQLHDIYGRIPYVRYEQDL